MAVSQFYKDNSETKELFINNVPITTTVTKFPVENLFQNKVLDNTACFSANTTKYFTDVWYGTKFKVNVTSTTPNITIKVDSEHEMIRQQSSKMLLTYNSVPQYLPTSDNLISYSDNRVIYNNTTGTTVHNIFDLRTQIVTNFDLNRIVLCLHKGNNLWDNNKPSYTTLDTGADSAKSNNAYVRVFYRKDDYTLENITHYFNISEIIQTDTDLILNQITNTNLLFNSRNTTGVTPFKEFPSSPVNTWGNTITKIDNKYLTHTSDFSTITTESGTNFQYINGDSENTGTTCATYWSGTNVCKYMTTALNSQLKKILASFGLRFIYCTPNTITDKASYDANIKIAYMDEDGYVNPDIILNGTDEINASDTHNKDINYNVMPVIPDTPNPYPKQDDKIDPMNYRLSNQLGGFTTYYKVTKDDLARIINAVNHPDQDNPIPDGYEFLPHVVSVMQYPFNVSQYVHGTTSNVVIGGYDTKVSALSLDSTQLAVQNIATIHISEKYKNFLDKSPFTQIELFIPLCGWVIIPDTAVGHDITVSLCVDPVGLGVIGKVTKDGMVIAEKSGKMGVTISISATETGLKNASLTQAIFNVMGSTLSTGYALTTGNPVGVVGGVMGVASAISQGNIANNSNYTRAVGNTGDMSENHISNSCYLKITFPLADIPDNFAHTYGYICNQTHKLSNCSGFTSCEHPDLTGISATESEKTHIKTLLESGVYI